MTSVLRRRYSRLLRWYPAADRADRGVEIVDTYVDLARAGQRWPRPGDVVDLMVGGLRQHLRARNALGLADALPVAGTLALATATVLAAVWMVLTEAFAGRYGSIEDPMLGPFHTLGAPVWIAWLVAPLAAPAGLGRWAVGVAVTVTIAVTGTVAVIPAMELTSLHPHLFMLLPQLGLGMVAMAAPRRRGYREIALVTGLAAAAAAAAVLVGSQHYVRHPVLFAAGLLLALAGIVTGVVFTVRRDRRGWWPALVLVWPVLLLDMILPEDLAYLHESRRIAVAWAMVSLAVAGAALLAAVTWQARRARRQAALYE